MSSPGGSVVKTPPASAVDAGSTPESGGSPGEGIGDPLRYLCLGNPMDRGAWWGYSPWGCKRVGHDWATQQQEHTSWDSIVFGLPYALQKFHVLPSPCSWFPLPSLPLFSGNHCSDVSACLFLFIWFVHLFCCSFFTTYKQNYTIFVFLQLILTRECLGAQSCPILWDLVDCSPPGSSVHDFPGKDAGVGCHFLFQGIFLTQGSNAGLLHLLHWQVNFLP